jgi:hypothetical protein
MTRISMESSVSHIPIFLLLVVKAATSNKSSILNIVFWTVTRLSLNHSTMVTTVRNLVTVLEMFLPGGMSMQRAFSVLAMVASLAPLLRLHRNQRQQPRQPRETAWLTSISNLIFSAFSNDGEEIEPPFHEYVTDMYQDIDGIYEFLGLNPHDGGVNTETLFPQQPPILCTNRLECIICPDNTEHHTLRRQGKMQHVRLLDSSYHWRDAKLFVAYCPSCRSDYFPDKITYRDADGSWRQKLECDATYLRVSKHGVWVHQQVALAQEHALHRFHAGWSNFAEWINDSSSSQPTFKFTYRQSQRLFLEHFSRRLLVAHGQQDTFTSIAHPSLHLLAEGILDKIGRDGGVLPGALHHGCKDCTHKKRYRDDLVNEGFVFDGSGDIVADIPDAGLDDTREDDGVRMNVL